MRVVYIVSDGGHDYSKASKFGELLYCTRGSLDKWDLSQMYRVLTTALEGAQASDLILITSLTSLCCIASAIMAARFGEVHFLLFKEGEYIEHSLILDKDTQDDNIGNRVTS